MFKRIVLLLITVILMNGCAVYQGTYNIALKNVESPETVKESGDYKIRTFNVSAGERYSYDDGQVKIVWEYDPKMFLFRLENKTDKSIKIIWDEALYVNENGVSGKVVHEGVRYVDRDGVQPPTVVIRKGRVNDFMIPTNKIYYLNGVGWMTAPLWPNRTKSETDLDIMRQRYVGKDVQVLLPIEINGVVNEYIFTFNIEEFVLNS